jgi:hypothetical protein
MRQRVVYLEALNRTQDLLNIKWALISAGYTIGSTWHDGEATTSPWALMDHWDAKSMEQLQNCDALVVTSGTVGRAAVPELAMMAGFALARGLRIVWIGSAIAGLSNLKAVQHFNTAEDFRKQILSQMCSQPMSVEGRLAA